MKKKHKADFADDFVIDIVDSRTREERMKDKVGYCPISLGVPEKFKFVSVRAYRVLVIFNLLLIALNLFLMYRISQLLALVIKI